MKQFGKLLCLLLALLMVLSLTTTAFAAVTPTTGKGTDNDGKITITNTVKDKKYTIYRIFDLESFSDSTPDNHNDGAYSYKVSEKWANFFTEGAVGLTYVTIENGYVKWETNASAANFAAAAIAFAEAEGTTIANDGQQTSDADNSNVEFTGLPLGYYLVKSDLGALCALTTTNKTATVTEKNAAPSFVKEVNEPTAAGTANWGAENDASIGDTVEFRATITVEGDAKSYVMHDAMDDGLTYKSVTKVTLNNTDVANTNYTVTTNVSHTPPEGGTATTDTFDVTFTDDFCNTLKSGDKICIYYTATLNENAVVNNPENNKAHLAYKDKSNVDKETAPSSTTTKTWQIPVLKYQNGDTNKPLAGAKFTLYKTETTAGDGTKTYTNPVKFKQQAAQGTTDIYEVTAANDGITEITTGTSGFFNLQGLDSGTYYLKETEAPLGYNQLDTVITVAIDSEGKINATAENTAGATRIEVENKSGAELPGTGGMGTTLFYIFGSILVVCAGVLLVTRKRMSVQG